MARTTIRRLEHTGDVAFDVRAAELTDLFEGARRALLSELMLRPPDVGAEQARVSLEAPAPDRLLLRWLDELLYLVQTRSLVPAAADLTLLPPEAGRAAWQLDAELKLAPLDPQAHGWRGEVKAATYHGLELTRDRRAWRARVVLDV